jgi:hypothetical protein
MSDELLDVDIMSTRYWCPTCQRLLVLEDNVMANEWTDHHWHRHETNQHQVIRIPAGDSLSEILNQ